MKFEILFMKWNFHWTELIDSYLSNNIVTIGRIVIDLYLFSELFLHKIFNINMSYH